MRCGRHEPRISMRIGNVCGRYEGDRPDLPCLMLGSHYDTVRDAGKWDGPLGLITAISCVADLNRRGKRLPFAIEVVGFADEEGVRFASTLLGSRAVAGTFDESALGSKDRSGITMRDALTQFGLDPDHIGAAARVRRELHAYVELHIEQGPVLEVENLPVGVVTAISGATRLAVVLAGMAGHAARCRWRFAATRWRAPPNASRRSRNSARPTRDCRHRGLHQCHAGRHQCDSRKSVVHRSISAPPSDYHRKLAVADIVRRIRTIAKRRNLVLQIHITHENRTVPCAPWLKHAVRGRRRRRGISRVRTSERRRSRRHGDDRHRRRGDAIRALPRRHQPSSGRTCRTRRRRRRSAGVTACDRELSARQKLARDVELTSSRYAVCGSRHAWSLGPNRYRATRTCREDRSEERSVSAIRV